MSGAGAEAETLSLRYLRTRSVADLEPAIVANERLLADPGMAGAPLDERARVLTNAATLLLERAAVQGSLADRDLAIERLRSAVETAPDDWDGVATALVMLSRALGERFGVQRERADRDEAIACGRAALAATAEGSDDRRMAAGNLLDAFHRVLAGMQDDPSPERDALLEEGARLAEQIRSAPAADPAAQAGRLTSTGLFLFGHYAMTLHRPSLEASIADLGTAVRLAGEGSADRVHYNRNLGVALAERHRLDGAESDLRDGTAAFRIAIADGLKLAPEHALEAGEALAGWALRRGALDEAADARLAALRGRALLHVAQQRTADQEAWLRQSVGLPSRTAYVLARAGRAAEAVVALEGGLAMLLSERLGEVQSGAVLELHEIEALAARAPLVYLVCADEGGAALVVGPGDRHVRVQWLNELTTDALAGQLARYRDGIVGAGAGWRLRLEEVLAWLWRTTVGQVLDALGDARSAVLIPDGALGLLPLHAARRSPQDACALDRCAVRLAPVARALRVTDEEGPGFAAVGEPAREAEDPLPFAASEAYAAASSFGAPTILSGADATLDAVSAALGASSVVHFACHARVNMAAPRESALLLAGDDCLTLDDLLRRPAGRFRLAVLSACESGVQGETLPEEKFSLATGMLHAGAAGVVSSLWAVNDRTTMILMLKFYELWRHGRAEPAEALRGAQLWVRDSTNGEKLAFATAVADRAAARSETPATAASRLARAFSQGDESERLAGEPYHWAGFVYAGV